VLALALSASQSRESIIAVVVAAAVIWVLARTHGRRVLAVVVIIALGSVAQVVVRPSNLVEWQRRLVGVVDAFRVPSGAEPTVPPQPSGDPTADPAAVPTKVPPREIRVLYYQQGLRLWAHQPVLGYGVGQFGGIVAQENNPDWHLNPRFGPGGGFDRYGFKSVQVDSFWLHLTVEAGALGVLAYLTWLYLVLLPLLRRTPRLHRPRGPTPGDLDPGVRVAAFTYWAIGAVTFAVQVAFLSASLEDPLLPALLFTVVGLAWVIREDERPANPGNGDPDNPTVAAPASLSGP
jgi:O-antigen ligase